MPDAKAKPSKVVVTVNKVKDIVTFKSAKGYRTFFISFLGILGGVLNLVDWNGFFNDWKAGVTGVIMGVLMGLMRFYSNTPPGEANKPWPSPPAPPPVEIK